MINGPYANYFIMTLQGQGQFHVQKTHVEILRNVFRTEKGSFDVLAM